MEPKFKAICAWCPDKEKQDREAEAAGLLPTHTCCDTCKVKLLSDLEADLENERIAKALKTYKPSESEIQAIVKSEAEHFHKDL